MSAYITISFYHHISKIENYFCNKLKKTKKNFLQKRWQQFLYLDCLFNQENNKNKKEPQLLENSKIVWFWDYFFFLNP